MTTPLFGGIFQPFVRFLWMRCGFILFSSVSQLEEVLLAIVIDRLRCFQAGPYACDENGEALSHAQRSLDWLKLRTKARMARGVEGTHAK